MQIQSVTDGRLDRAERIVSEDPAELSVDGGPTELGTLTLTTARLLFDPAGRSACSPRLELPLTAITVAHIGGLRRRLCVQVGRAHALRVEGPSIGRIHGTLSALLHAALESDSSGAPEQHVDSWDAMLFRGPVAHPGTLVLTSRRLHFAPARALDIAAGAKPLDMPLWALNRVGIDGWPERRLVVTMRGSERRFAVDQPARLLEPIARELAHRVGPEERFDPLSLDDEALAVLALWRPHVGWDDSEEVVAAAPCLHRFSPALLLRAWLVRTSTRVLLLSAEGPDDAGTAIVLGGEDVLESKATVEDFDLVVRSKSAEVRLVPIGLDRPLRDPTRVPVVRRRTQKPSYYKENPVSMIVGQARFLRMSRDEEMLVSAQRHAIIDLGGQLGIELEGTPDRAFEDGARLTIEVGRREGVYQFDAVVRGLEAGSLAVGAADGAPILVVEPLTGIRFFNRRDRYRVAMQANVPVALHAAAEDEEVAQIVLLEDLSPTGCSLRASTFLGTGKRLQLELEVDGVPAAIAGEVVRSEATGLEPPWRHGVQFLDVPRLVQDCIYRELLRRQRNELARRADMRAIGIPAAAELR